MPWFGHAERLLTGASALARLDAIAARVGPAALRSRFGIQATALVGGTGIVPAARLRDFDDIPGRQILEGIGVVPKLGRGVGKFLGLLRFRPLAARKKYSACYQDCQ